MSGSAEAEVREAKTMRRLTLLSPLLQQVLGKNHVLFGERTAGKRRERSRWSTSARPTLVPPPARADPQLWYTTV